MKCKINSFYKLTGVPGWKPSSKFFFFFHFSHEWILFSLGANISICLFRVYHVARLAKNRPITDEGHGRCLAPLFILPIMFHDYLLIVVFRPIHRSESIYVRSFWGVVNNGKQLWKITISFSFELRPYIPIWSYLPSIIQYYHAVVVAGLYYPLRIIRGLLASPHEVVSVRQLHWIFEKYDIQRT